MIYENISLSLTLIKLIVSDGFELQCRVVNKPYDIFGTWYSDRHLLSGDLFWLAHLVSTTGLWLNKASQETASEHTPIMNQMFRFYNTNASSIRAIMVANCLTPEPVAAVAGTSANNTPIAGAAPPERGNPPSHRDLNRRSCSFRCNMHVDDNPPADHARYSCFGNLLISCAKMMCLVLDGTRVIQK